MNVRLHIVSGAALCAFAFLALGSGSKSSSDSANPAAASATAASTPPSTAAATAATATAAPKPAAPVSAVDLSPGGLKGLTVMAPAGVKVTESAGDCEVSDGAGFDLEVHSGPRDIAKSKKEISGNTVNTLKAWVTDSPDLVVYTSEAMPGHPEVHFLGNVKVGAKSYSCEDTKGAHIYTQDEVNAMVTACKSITKK